jgi:hypothetical protein
MACKTSQTHNTTEPQNNEIVEQNATKEQGKNKIRSSVAPKLWLEGVSGVRHVSVLDTTLKHVITLN